MLLRWPSHTPFFLPTHLDCIVYSLYKDLKLRAEIDGKGPILMKLRLGEVWCRDDEFRGQHSTSRSIINISLLSTYYAYNCRTWYHVSSYESIVWYDTGILFNSIKHYGGTSAEALSWLEEVDDDVGCGVCSANGGSQLHTDSYVYFTLGTYLHRNTFYLVW